MTYKLKLSPSLCRPVLALIATVVCATCLAQTGPSSYLTGYWYSSGRLLTGVVQPYSGTGTVAYLATRNTYNAAGLLSTAEKGSLSNWPSQTTAPANWSDFTQFQVESYGYDSMGRLSWKEQTSAGVVYSLTQYSYDSMGRQQCVAVRMNASQFSAMPAACTLGTAGTYGPDRITYTTYNAQSRVLTTQKAYGTSIQETYESYTYTPNGYPNTITDANGNLTTKSYDGLDRLSETQFPSKTTPGMSSTTDLEQYTYDANDNRLTLVNRESQTIGYTYDALNRLTFKNIPNSTLLDVYYAYDLRSLRTSAMFGLASGSGASAAGIATQFDGFGRVIYSTNTSDGYSRQLSYSYDANGNRLSIIHPDGAEFTYGYDGLNRAQFICEGSAACTASSSPILTIGYDTQGRRGSVTRANGAATSSYSYDQVSRIQTLSLNLDGSVTTNDVNYGFTYTPADQIGTRNITNGLYAFTPAATLITYAANGLNQYSTITASSGITPTYDADANMTFDGSSNYTYDVENRMLTAASSAYSASLSYDPDGRLLTLNSGSTSVHFLYDGNALVAEYNSSNVLQERYVHGPGVDEPLVWYQGATVGSTTRYFTVSNHQGSIVAITNSGGTTTAINTYGEFGQPSSANSGRFQYTGQIWLPQLGLFYYKARIYSPLLGRFMQTDPVGYVSDLNLYAYVYNDPANKADTSGNQEIPESEGAERDEIEVEQRDLEARDLMSEINEIQPGNGEMMPLGYRHTEADLQAMRTQLATLRAQAECRAPVDNSSGSSDTSTVTRYMGSGEAETVRNTGEVPSTSPEGQPRPTHVTTDPPVTSATEAQTKYELPVKPTHSVTVPASRVSDLGPPPGGRSTTSGGGSQSVTNRPFRAYTVEITELDP